MVSIKPQFSIRALLIVTSIVAVYVALTWKYLLHSGSQGRFETWLTLVPLTVAFCGVSADVFLLSHVSAARAMIVGGILAVVANIGWIAIYNGVDFIFEIPINPSGYAIYVTRHAGCGAMVGLIPVLMQRCCEWLRRKWE